MATLTRDLTYAQLVAAIAAGELNEGEGIWITDYQTVHTILNTSDTNTGEIEPLFVTAISNNELKPEAYSVAYPDDVIYYCPENDQTMVPGCTKGYIYRRVDTKQSNDFPFDFRQVKFRRWQIDVPNWDNATEYSKMSVVKRPTGTAQEQLEVYISLVDSNTNHAVTDSAYWRRFEFDNLAYVSPSESSWDRSDNIDFIIPCTALYQDYHFFATGDYSSCYSNKLESPKNNLIENSNTVVFGGGFYSNSIGANFGFNSIGGGFNSNSIGAGFNSNSIGVNFSFNSIRANFGFNSIGGGFYSNSIGANFGFNSIGGGFNSNSIGAGFNSNSIGVNFSFNSIGANFSFNSIGANFYNNNSVDNVTSIDFTAVAELYNKTYAHQVIGKEDGGCVVIWYDDAGDQQKIVI